MLYRLTISLLSTAVLLGGAATGLARDYGGQRGAFRANRTYHGTQARLARDEHRGYWHGDRDLGRYGFGYRGYYGGGKGFYWHGYAAPRYYYPPYRGYVYTPPTYYYAPYSYYPYTYTYGYAPYGYAAYPYYGNGLNFNLQLGGSDWDWDED
jgi:hypothetical protein